MAKTRSNIEFKYFCDWLRFSWQFRGRRPDLILNSNTFTFTGSNIEYCRNLVQKSKSCTVFGAKVLIMWKRTYVRKRENMWKRTYVRKRENMWKTWKHVRFLGQWFYKGTQINVRTYEDVKTCENVRTYENVKTCEKRENMWGFWGNGFIKELR